MRYFIHLADLFRDKASYLPNTEARDEVWNQQTDRRTDGRMDGRMDGAALEGTAAF